MNNRKDNQSQSGGHSHSHSGGHSHTGQHAHGVSSEQGFVVEQNLGAPEVRQPGFGKGKSIFLDPQSGIAGDMFVAAYLDLGVPLSAIQEALSSIALTGYEITLRRGFSGVIATTHFSVSETKPQPPRSYAAIKEMLSHSALSSGVKERALAIFLTLGQAESEVHGLALADVEFHEVGALDSIIDIVAAATCIDYAGAELLVGPVQVGQGWVNCQHGRLPLPAPATLNCLKTIPLKSSGLDVELVTPTGAAIIGSQAHAYHQMPPFVLESVAYGAGTRGLPDRPNALRLLFGNLTAEQGDLKQNLEGLASRSLVLLSANLDDMTGEALGFATTELTAASALDVWLSPITMKKGRPAVELSLLTTPERAAHFVQKIMALTSTLGVRQAFVERMELARESVTVSTRWGDVRVKRAERGGAKPEFEDCARIAREEQLSLAEVVAEALRVYQGL